MSSAKSTGAENADASSSRSRALQILLAHNRYREPGGEDAVVRSERDLLRAAGHHVREYTRTNDEIRFPAKLLSSACGTVWARDTHRELSRILSREAIDVAHFHNTFPLISPSAYEACRAARVPVLQTLHNYRLFCPAALLFRDGQVCEDCSDHSLWQSVVHGCYRDSRAETAVVALMLAFHRWRGTWDECVDRYLTLTEFSRQKLIELGLPAEKIVVKSNFVHPDPGAGHGRGGYAVFVGRLSAEKGVRTLLSAWRHLRSPVPLKIVGDGPDAPLVREAAAGMSHVEWMGRRPASEVLDCIGGASFLVFPSEWYEVCPRVLIESMAKGTPVLAAAIGAAAELVHHGRTGLHFRAGDPEDLAAQVDRLMRNGAELRYLACEARREYESRYTASRNYATMMSIYAELRPERR